jgi:ribonuclease-3
MQNKSELLFIELGYVFKDYALLQQALTHKSYSSLNYERLEFVGDSILNYAITTSLYELYPQLNEGDLSKMRATLINQNTLCEIAQSIKLDNYLIVNAQENDIKLRSAVMADALEAIFAAINFDSNLLQAVAVIKTLYQKKLDALTLTSYSDNKSLLQEYLQEHNIQLPQYNVLELIGPDHAITFKLECKIPELNISVIKLGKSKKEASQLAAAEALNIIRAKVK